MAEEVEPIKEAGEAAAALAEVFIDETGVALVPKTYFGYVAQRVHYRHYPKLIERAMAAAEKIRASGLPAYAYNSLEDPLLTAILEAGAEEEDPGLQTVWENLLANALTDESPGVRRAYPRILQELDPVDVRLLDKLSRGVSRSTYHLYVHRPRGGSNGMDVVALQNLTRLELMRAVRSIPTTVGSIEDKNAKLVGYVFTDLGWAFVQACRPPQPPE